MSTKKLFVIKINLFICVINLDMAEKIGSQRSQAGGGDKKIKDLKPPVVILQ